MIPKLLYGLGFVCVLPALLVLWAMASSSNVTLPSFGNAGLGLALLAPGAALMFMGMLDLWRFGGGLPMNAFPPPRLVKRGAFRWVPHPIYTGAVITCLGIAMASGSAAGLWLVTPTLALGCTALVLGYERRDLAKRFGVTLALLPPDDHTEPSFGDRIRYYLYAALPWIALYEITIQIPAAGTAFGFQWESRLPIWTWTSPIYQSVYVAAALAPWFVRTRRELRSLIVTVWVACLVVFPLYWVMPSSAPRRAINGGPWVAEIFRWERDSYPPVAAFPSFHVLWAIFLGRLFRWRWLGVTYAAAVSASCITTGQHYVADIAASVAIAPLFLHPDRAWEVLRRGAQKLANSWREWHVGSVRIINHGVYGGLASFVQVAVVLAVAGSGQTAAVLATALSGLLGAAIWAQVVEGSSRLRRPFGFYGGLIAAGACCLLFEQRWLLLGAHCLAAPWMQALGRLRCLVNGCCHGAAASGAAGIRVVAPQSRVSRLAHLAAVPIYPTQLYSILSNAVLGLLLIHLWTCGVSLSIVCGVYAIGNGLARFVEEAYRGEPQTRLLGGLRLYQWIAIGSVMAGGVLTSLRSPTAQTFSITMSACLPAALFGLLAGVALGVDLPESDRPFARLT